MDEVIKVLIFFQKSIFDMLKNELE